MPSSTPRRVVGDLGWSLDALEDIVVDLDAGVWNRAWLMFRHGLPDDAAWHALLARPDDAVLSLECAGTIDALLGGIERGLAELSASPELPADSRRQLADIGRLLVWSFLARPSAP